MCVGGGGVYYLQRLPGYLYTVGKVTDSVHVTFRIDDKAERNIICKLCITFKVISFQDDAFDNYARHGRHITHDTISIMYYVHTKMTQCEV